MVNIIPEQASAQLPRVVDELVDLQPALNDITEALGQVFLDAHRRVRSAARQTGLRYSVRPQLPPDVLGVCELLPVVV